MLHFGKGSPEASFSEDGRAHDRRHVHDSARKSLVLRNQKAKDHSPASCSPETIHPFSPHSTNCLADSSIHNWHYTHVPYHISSCRCCDHRKGLWPPRGITTICIDDSGQVCTGLHDYLLHR
ncbi:hypothetical protein CEUSTIGMA_g10097.t1 [Chlamydomonas eustigma]|uniref:Uncharacterized protein n=1 Tax=Chlamydomonas eustigma TaxID=1157962 RepID=A0A250XHW6_9CHLO|nr:hypothetical protein CEUSTIGMA_g10097.t1 [Chlamydomonas eustigma]|eukprot:GAX82671.1 hypothetical protein CEUSTIGMA_g10097.t1 [Chlamydomonas eustigma]